MDDPRPSPKKAANSLSNYKPLTAIEAMQLATLLCGQFPTVSRGDEIFLRSLADLLASFPRAVVEDCVNPRFGLATEIDFVSLRAVQDWCEDRAERFHRQATYEMRVAKQIAERERKPITARMKALAEAWLNRSDPVAAELSGERAKRERLDRLFPEPIRPLTELPLASPELAELLKRQEGGRVGGADDPR